MKSNFKEGRDASTENCVNVGEERRTEVEERLLLLCERDQEENVGCQMSVFDVGVVTGPSRGKRGAE